MQPTTDLSPFMDCFTKLEKNSLMIKEFYRLNKGRWWKNLNNNYNGIKESKMVNESIRKVRGGNGLHIYLNVDV